MFTDRFDKIRRAKLDNILDNKEICKLWRSKVKNQLRSFDLKDLYDYYEFNYNIEIQVKQIRSEILNGNYRPSEPLIYRVEKKFGICRHLIMPQPADALVIQVLTDTFYEEVIKSSPSRNTFYSRDRHSVKYPHQIEKDSQDWSSQWKRMQKLIYNFQHSKNLLVVTDLSNYYDSIDVNLLKSNILNVVNQKDVLIDILFKIIEHISWTPDYLPYSGRGLPTVNIEGVRLLGHLFLFELDNILEQTSDKSFTRWMDDVVIGVDSEDEAYVVLSSASDVLKSKGLALNMAKTAIYDASNAEYHFQIKQNEYLDSIDTSLQKGKEYNELTSELKRKLKAHFKDDNAKYWDKVTKRYITAFATLKSPKLLSEALTLYQSYPSCRSYLLWYLEALGPIKKCKEIMLEIIKGLKPYDDTTLFDIANRITLWQMENNSSTDSFIRDVESTMIERMLKTKSPFDFYCILWLKAKYNAPIAIKDFIEKYQFWKSSPFVRRQVTAVMSRVLIVDSNYANNILRRSVSNNNFQISSLASQINEFSSLQKSNKKLNSYLFPLNSKSAYPLSKFLILCNVLYSDSIRQNASFTEKIKDTITDPIYRKWLKDFYAIQI